MAEPQPTKRTIDSLTVKIALGVTLLVVATLIPAGYLAATSHYRGQMELKHAAVRTQGELIRVGLEHDMLSNERELIAQMVTAYGKSPGIKQVMVFDRWGRLRFASNKRLFQARFSRDASSECKVCHEKPAAARAASVLVKHGTALRHAIPLKNRRACHSCHDPAHAINGILLIDSTVDDALSRLTSDLLFLTGGVGVMALLLLAGTRLIIKRFVMNPLAHLESSTRAMAAGDFNRRIVVTGEGGIARLGREFNAMADSISELMIELRLQREQLENVMNSVDDGLVVMDETQTITAVNTAMARRFGVEPADLLFKRCRDLRQDPRCQKHSTKDRCAAAACFATGKLQTSFFTRLDAAGAEREEEVFSSPIFDDDGRTVAIVEVWRDITERKSHEARMAEVQRLASLGMLASGFSHEVNTPLGTMLIHVDEVRSAAARPEADTRAMAVHAERIRAEILRCRGITQQFLRLSRGHALTRDVIDLPPVVAATVPLVAHTAREVGVRIGVVEGRVPVVQANTGAVQQVLLNLLLNAVQACEEGGTITISFHASGPGGGRNPEVAIRISDDGAGMTPDVSSKIFEPFFSKRASGSGLGLFVSLNLARHWDGDIRVTSAPGEGSTFEVVFPRHGEGEA